jgi:hypothetical protein
MQASVQFPGISVTILDVLYVVVFFCVGVMYSGEYDACDVTLSVYPHRASLKNMPDHGGNRTYVVYIIITSVHQKL